MYEQLKKLVVERFPNPDDRNTLLAAIEALIESEQGEPIWLLQKHHRIIQAVVEERNYQDKKWGTIEDHPHSPLEWLEIMEYEIKEAKAAWRKKRPCYPYMAAETIQAIATGFAFLEQHGVRTRFNLPEQPIEMPVIPNLSPEEIELVRDRVIDWLEKEANPLFQSPPLPGEHDAVDGPADNRLRDGVENDE